MLESRNKPLEKLSSQPARAGSTRRSVKQAIVLSIKESGEHILYISSSPSSYFLLQNNSLIVSGSYLFLLSLTTSHKVKLISASTPLKNQSMAYNRIEAVSSSSQSSPTQQVIPSGSRSGITRNASYNLKDVHGSGEQARNDQDDFEITNADGQVVRIKDSGIVHTLSHKKCISENANLGLVATLFYCPTKEFINPGAELHEIPCEDVNFGNYVSDMAIFEFVQTIDDIMVPWKKRTGTTHKCLDVAPAPGIMEILLPRPEILSLVDLRRHVDLWKFENKWKIQVVLQENDVCRRFKRLVVFDMDSTLIQQEVIDEVASYVGVKDEVSVSFLLEKFPG